MCVPGEQGGRGTLDLDSRIADRIGSCAARFWILDGGLRVWCAGTRSQREGEEEEARAGRRRERQSLRLCRNGGCGERGSQGGVEGDEEYWLFWKPEE